MKSSTNRPTARIPQKRAAFEVRAERALRRAVRKVREENNRLGLPLIIWQDGRVARIQSQP